MQDSALPCPDPDHPTCIDVCSQTALNSQQEQSSPQSPSHHINHTPTCPTHPNTGEGEKPPSQGLEHPPPRPWRNSLVRQLLTNLIATYSFV